MRDEKRLTKVHSSTAIEMVRLAVAVAQRTPKIFTYQFGRNLLQFYDLVAIVEVMEKRKEVLEEEESSEDASVGRKKKGEEG